MVSPTGKNYPLGKAWGLQTDGDLWEQAWKAILKRGSQNQKLRKVKGHATRADIEAGLATQEDREGNDKADKEADEGVMAIQGEGLVLLADWMARRHKEYKMLVMRIQKFTAGIIIAEKEERDKDNKIAKGVLGYDPEVWIKSNGNIRDERKDTVAYSKLEMPPAVQGTAESFTNKSIAS